jgi:hypothetical protein
VVAVVFVAVFVAADVDVDGCPCGPCGVPDRAAASAGQRRRGCGRGVTVRGNRLRVTGSHASRPVQPGRIPFLPRPPRSEGQRGAAGRMIFSLPPAKRSAAGGGGQDDLLPPPREAKRSGGRGRDDLLPRPTRSEGQRGAAGRMIFSLAPREAKRSGGRGRDDLLPPPPREAKRSGGGGQDDLLPRPPREAKRSGGRGPGRGGLGRAGCGLRIA